MKNVKLLVKDWFIPPKFWNMLSATKKYWYNLKYDLSVIKRNEDLKNKYFGKRCFILGNAPTIKNIDILKLKDEYVFVMSTFYNHPDYKKLNKTFHSSVHLTGAKSYKDQLNWLKAIEVNSPNTQIFFFGMEQKEVIEENNLFKGKKVYYIATLPGIKRSFNIAKLTRSYQTNVIQALEIAIYMGFKEIYLHSVNLNSVCTGTYEYFFDRKKLPHPDPEVSSDNICKDYVRLFESIFNAIKEIWEVYLYAREKGVKIFYTNAESILKFLEYIPFDKVLNT